MTGGEQPLIRRMTPDDLPQVLAMERASGQPLLWDRGHFGHLLASPNLHPVVMVLPSRGTVLGYLAFRHANDNGVPLDHCQVISVVVATPYRRQGVGRTLVVWLQTCGESFDRAAILAVVRESDLPAQLFLKACRFRCDSIEFDCFENPVEPGYRFVWLASEDAIFSPPTPTHSGGTSTGP